MKMFVQLFKTHFALFQQNKPSCYMFGISIYLLSTLSMLKIQHPLLELNDAEKKFSTWVFYDSKNETISFKKLAMHSCQISSRTNEQQQIDGLGVLFAVYEHFSPCSN